MISNDSDGFGVSPISYLDFRRISVKPCVVSSGLRVEQTDYQDSSECLPLSSFLIACLQIFARILNLEASQLEMPDAGWRYHLRKGFSLTKRKHRSQS